MMVHTGGYRAHIGVQNVLGYRVEGAEAGSELSFAFCYLGVLGRWCASSILD